MVPEAACQGRDDVSVAQLRRVHVDVAEQPETEPGEARAPEQHMLRCICFSGQPAHAPGGGRCGQVLAGHSPVAGP